jgi:hypothetical protein
MTAVEEDMFADVCVDTLHEWLEYFHQYSDGGDQYKAERVDDAETLGEAVFRVRHVQSGTIQMFSVKVQVKELTDGQEQQV